MERNNLPFYDQQATQWWSETATIFPLSKLNPLRFKYFDRVIPQWHGLRVLDVGCGIGGSSRVLAKDYGFEVTGVTISPGQVERATQLTPAGISAKFLVDDAMALSFPDESFDVVWSLEAGPHMPDKAVFARELLRVLKPGGLLVVGDWNQRDDRRKPLNWWEKPVMTQLLDQWSHPQFSSIEGFS